MPIITEGSSADVVLSGNSTLTIQNPSGFATVEFPIGTVVWKGGQANKQLDLNNGTARITANTGLVTYYATGDNLIQDLQGSVDVNGTPTLITTNSAGQTVATVVVPKNYKPVSSAIDMLLSSGEPTAAPLMLTAPPNVQYGFFVDPVDGNDSWDGSQPAFTSGSAGPKKTLNTAVWTGTRTAWAAGEYAALKRGTVYTHSVTTGPLDISARFLMAYGDPNLARPIVRGMNAAANMNTMVICYGTSNQAGSADIIFDASDISNRHSVLVYNSTAGLTISNKYFFNCDFTGALGTTYGAWRNGLHIANTFSTGTTDYVGSRDIHVYGCSAYNNSGHGFSAYGAIGVNDGSGNWFGIDYVNCTAYNNGLSYESHNFTSATANAVLASPTWTLVSGTIYSTSLANTVNLAQNARVDICYIVLTGKPYTLKKTAAAANSPGVGEFGFDPATQLLYVNINAVVSSAGLRFCLAAARGIRYFNCTSTDNATATSAEGMGIALDDYTSNSQIWNCVIERNSGSGISVNSGVGNLVCGNLIRSSGRAPILNIYGIGNTYRRNYLHQPSGMATQYNAMIVDSCTSYYPTQTFSDPRNHYIANTLDNGGSAVYPIQNQYYSAYPSVPMHTRLIGDYLQEINKNSIYFGIPTY